MHCCPLVRGNIKLSSIRYVPYGAYLYVFRLCECAARSYVQVDEHVCILVHVLRSAQHAVSACFLLSVFRKDTYVFIHLAVSITNI